MRAGGEKNDVYGNAVHTTPFKLNADSTANHMKRHVVKALPSHSSSSWKIDCRVWMDKVPLLSGMSAPVDRCNECVFPLNNSAWSGCRNWFLVGVSVGAATAQRQRDSAGAFVDADVWHVLRTQLFVLIGTECADERMAHNGMAKFPIALCAIVPYAERPNQTCSRTADFNVYLSVE